MNRLYRWNRDVRRCTSLRRYTMIWSHGTTGCGRCTSWGAAYLIPDGKREQNVQTYDWRSHDFAK